MVDQQWSWRENKALTRRLQLAKLRLNACAEDIDYRRARGLDKSVIRALTQESGWVKNHEDVFVLGPTGVGKSYIACALAQKACRDGYSALYTRASALFRELALARATGHLLARLARIDVLVVDDWAMAPSSESERRDFWEICEDRYEPPSTVLTSQLPVSKWHEQIGGPTAADGILDGLVLNVHRLEMRGDSMRKKRGPEPASGRCAGLHLLCRGKGLPPLATPLSPSPQSSPGDCCLRCLRDRVRLHRNAVRLPSDCAFDLTGIRNQVWSGDITYIPTGRVLLT